LTAQVRESTHEADK